MDRLLGSPSRILCIILAEVKVLPIDTGVVLCNIFVVTKVVHFLLIS
jgi:hypothetical protein